MIQNLIRQALDYAEDRLSVGLLVRCKDTTGDEPDEYWTTPKGDRETIYSIASLYADQVEFNSDEALDLIEDALMEKYTDYI